MATGQAAGQAAQRNPGTEPDSNDDRGPGSVSGNICKDVDLHYTNSGRPVVNLRVASSERIRDEATGEWKDGTTAYYDVTCWGNLAENAAEYLAKGDRVVAEGRWRSNTWEDEQGVVRERMVLNARDLGPSMMFRGARLIRREAR